MVTYCVKCHSVRAFFVGALQMTAGAEQTPAAVAPIIENLEDEVC